MISHLGCWTVVNRSRSMGRARAVDSASNVWVSCKGDLMLDLQKKRRRGTDGSVSSFILFFHNYLLVNLRQPWRIRLVGRARYVGLVASQCG